MAQGGHGIDAYGPARWNVRSEHCNGCEHKCSCCERQRIGGAHGVEQIRHQSREPERCGHADRHADTGDLPSLYSNHAQYITALGAKRQANPDLMCTLCYGVGNHTVNSDRRQYQRKRAKKPEKDESHP